MSSKIKELREKMHMSQSEFAGYLNIPVKNIQNWEQGRCTPTGPARILLVVADRNPDLLIKTLAPEMASLEREPAFA